MHQEPIVLVCAADDLFAMPLAVTARSVIENLSQEYCLDLYIIDSGISLKNRRKILDSLASDRVKIEWIEILSPDFKVVLPQLGEFSFSQLKELSTSSQVAYPAATYARLLIPYILPSSIKKAIYLDTDIVVEGNLSQLWNIDLGEYYIAAVQEHFTHYLSHLRHLDCQKLGISSNAKHFNSGVMLLNLEQWRNHYLAEKTIRFILEYPECITGDQDALNVILADHWLALSPRWNQLNGLFFSSSWKETPYTEADFNDALNHPFIVHFTDRPKPWIAECIHPKKDLFFQYLDRTAWANWRPTFLNQSWNKGQRAIRKLMWKMKKLGFA